MHQPAKAHNSFLKKINRAEDTLSVLYPPPDASQCREGTFLDEAKDNLYSLQSGVVPEFRIFTAV